MRSRRLIKLLSIGFASTSVPVIILSQLDLEELLLWSFPKKTYDIEDIDVKSLLQTNENRYVILVKDVLRVTYLWLLFMPCMMLFPLFYFNLIDNVFYTTLNYTLEYAGPTFIKIGQWVSTRNDMFSPKFCKAMASLQDNVAHESYDQVIKTIEEGIDSPIHHVFSSLDPEPLGAGCIAQVHRAVYNGQQVAIKVQRKNILKTVTQDLRLLSYAQHLIFSDEAFFNTMTKLMLIQIDFRNEAKHLKIFNENFKSSSTIFPKPIYATKDLLIETLEEGDQLSEYILTASLKQKIELSTKITNTYLQMMAKDNFIHGDLHPGNILVNKNNELILLDAGIIIHLDKADHRNVVDLIKMIVRKDTNSELGKLLIERAPDKGESMTKYQKFKFIHDIIDIKEQLDRDMGDFNSGKGWVQLLKAIRESNLKLPYSLSSTILSITLVHGISYSLYPQVDTIKNIANYLFFN